MIATAREAALLEQRLAEQPSDRRAGGEHAGFRCSGRISRRPQRGGDADRTPPGRCPKTISTKLACRSRRSILSREARQQQGAVERREVGCRNHGPRRLSYPRAVKSILSLVAILSLAPLPALAQPGEKITVMLDARTEGRPTRDAAATKLLADVRRGLEAIGDVEVVPAEHARRTTWIVTGAAPRQPAATVIVTELYDREPPVVLGIEDDDMAGMRCRSWSITRSTPAATAAVASARQGGQRRHSTAACAQAETVGSAGRRRPTRDRRRGRLVNSAA